MRRRDFLAGMGGFIAPIHCANAQQRPVPIIGFLSSLPQASGRNRPGFLEGLGEIGFIEGTSVVVEYRWADGDYSRLPTLASEFVQEKVAVIVAEYLPAALAAKEATGTIPIIFVSGADPVKFGLVTSFNAPSGNATGVFQYIGPLSAKRLELLRELLPHASTIALLSNPTNPNADRNLEDFRAAALGRGLSLRVFRASTPKDIIDAFSHPQMGFVHAVLVLDDPFLHSQTAEIVHRAARHSIPAIFPGRTRPTLGALMGYGASSADVNRLVGVYVGRILRGEKPSDLRPASHQVRASHQRENRSGARPDSPAHPPRSRRRGDRMICLRALALGLALLWASAAWAQSCPKGTFENFPPGEAAALGFDPGVLADAIRDLRRSNHDIRSLLVVKNCALVVELYKVGHGRDFTHSMYSVAKSFVVTLAGILVREEKLSLDAALTTVLDRPSAIADATWARAGKVSVRHVFGMLSGYEYVHTPTHHPLYTAMDRRVIALLPGTEAAPGTRFKYSDADAVLAAATVAKAAGRDLLAFARDALFKPLGFREVEWWFRDHAGQYHAGGGLRVRPMDAAKLGQLYLQRGLWDGREIIAPSFIEEVWRAGPNPHYGLFWWRTSSDNGFFAWGWKGQRVFVFPELELVIVTTAHMDDEKSPDLHSAVRKIVSAVREKPSVMASEASEALRRELAEPFDGNIPGPVPLPEDRPGKL